MITSIRRQCAGCLRKAHSFVDSHLRYWKHHLKLPTRPMLKLGRKTLASRKFSTVSWPSDRKAIHGGRLPSFPSIVFKLKCLVGLEALAASFIKPNVGCRLSDKSGHSVDFGRGWFVR